MKIKTNCLECIIRQTRKVAERCTRDPDRVMAILQETMRQLAAEKLDRSPAFHTNTPYHTATAMTGVADPFAEDKRHQNALVLAMADDLRGLIRGSGDPLRTAAKLAVAGNVIDLGIIQDFNLRHEIDKVLREDFARNDYDSFASELPNAKTLLYLCDNAGEIVCDRLFMEALRSHHPDLSICAVIKSGPIINDAMAEDAETVGLHDVARVIPCGGPYCGTPYSLVTQEVRNLLDSADLVISKGQGNFETLSDIPRPIYFMLKAKCPSVAEELGIQYGEVVFLKKTGKA